MPKRVIGILVISVLAALTGAAGQTHENPKTSTSTSASTPTQPSPQPQQTSAATAKFGPVSRDVCAKHPNLKQCS
jgi:hypothetical protein